MRKLALAVLLVLVAVLSMVACNSSDSARVAQLESDIEELQSTWSAGDFEGRISRLEESLYGSNRSGVGVRGALTRLYELEAKVGSLEPTH